MRGEEEAPEGIRERVLGICERYIPHGMIAELGCGYGHFSRIASKIGFKTIGVEINTRKINKRIQPIIRANLNNTLPLKNGVFECLVAIEVIEHLENPWYFLREIKRILKNNGIAIFTFPNFTDFTSRIRFFFKTEFSFFIKKIPEDGHISLITYWLFKFMAKKEDFKRLNSIWSLTSGWNLVLYRKRKNKCGVDSTPLHRT